MGVRVQAEHLRASGIWAGTSYAGAEQRRATCELLWNGSSDRGSAAGPLVELWNG